jgi:hypothetical protein
MGDLISTKVSRNRAGAIIARMEDLLAARRQLRISRTVFLAKWGKLRKALFLTRDYQELIQRLNKRSGGVCEMCRSRAGEHVCHIEPVAYNPRLVLMDLNCKWGCEHCHDVMDGRKAK